MNIADPIAEAIDGVEFGFLGSAEIKKLSVKRIYNPTTFDTLLHPTPGGLYDPALGAFLDNRWGLVIHLGDSRANRCIDVQHVDKRIFEVDSEDVLDMLDTLSCPCRSFTHSSWTR